MTMSKSHLAIFLILGFVTSTFSEEKRPNIIFIMADDLGRNDISFYGDHKNGVETPNIDRIFRSGISFQNFYSNSPVCSPTRAALMTGLYPDRAGVPGVVRQDQSENWGHLRHDLKLLPSQLKSLGYQTSMVGKWHLGYESPNIPNDRGFDRFHGFLGDMMDDYETHLRIGKNWMRHNLDEIQPKGHATDLFTSWAVDELKSLSSKDQPFFLYLAYNAPHAPIQPGLSWLDKVRKSRPELTEKRAKLVALIEQMDDGIGQILYTVKSSGIENKTLIVFTSDNGGQLNLSADNGPWRGSKGETFDGGLRVVCGATWPTHIPSGLKTHITSATFDWYPTLIEMAGGDLSKIPSDGKSLRNILENPSNIANYENRELYFVRREGGLPFSGKTIEALRLGDWKIVLNTPFEPAQLFHLKDDPYETRDLSANQPIKKRQMIQRLQYHIQRGGQIPWQKGKETP
jgi:arylsulfatase A-like enzyme